VVVIDGALDGLEPALALRIVTRLTALGSTVVVVTADPAMAAALPRTIALTTPPTLPSPPTPTTTTPTTMQDPPPKAGERKGGGR
jgi:hypothetical protein